MRTKILLSCALLAFFIGLGLLIAGWDGTSSVSLASPLRESMVQLSGRVKGWDAIAGLAGLISALALFLWGLISLATAGRRKARKGRLPEPQRASEAKVQVTSR